MKHAQFVDGAISELLRAGSVAVSPPSDIEVISPLGVAEQSKLRLILELRYLNSYLSKRSFRYEDIKTASDIFRLGDFMFTFDLKSAYHHIDIAPAYRKYLGFRWCYHGSRRTSSFAPYRLALR